MWCKILNNTTFLIDGVQKSALWNDLKALHSQASATWFMYRIEEMVPIQWDLMYDFKANKQAKTTLIEMLACVHWILYPSEFVYFCVWILKWNKNRSLSTVSWENNFDDSAERSLSIGKYSHQLHMPRDVSYDALFTLANIMPTHHMWTQA